MSPESQGFPVTVGANPSQEAPRAAAGKQSETEAAGEKSLVCKSSFVVKEIINTGLPGRKTAATTFRRWDIKYEQIMMVMIMIMMVVTMMMMVMRIFMKMMMMMIVIMMMKMMMIKMMMMMMVMMIVII